MPNRTLYINNDNWAKFKDEPSMSALVNVLLKHHYEKYRGKDLKDLREKTFEVMLRESAKKASEAQKKTIQKANDKIAFDAFNGANTKDFVATGTLTCPAGHPSKDGRHCNNLKCAYGG